MKPFGRVTETILFLILFVIAIFYRNHLLCSIIISIVLIFISVVICIKENKKKTEKKGSSQFDASFEIKGTDYIEFYVQNARQAMYWWYRAIGFSPIAVYGDLNSEGGSSSRGITSYIIRQGDITIKLTSPLESGGSINRKINKHGDYVVRYIGIRVEDATKAWEISTLKGAQSFLEPKREEDEHGYVIRSGVHANWGDVVHIFIERKHYHGQFLPGYSDFENTEYFESSKPVGLNNFDHIVPNMEPGRLKDASDFYRNIFGLDLTYELKTRDQYSSVDLEVMSSKNQLVRFNVIQPQKKGSFANDFINWYHGEGVNHVALSCTDIITVVSEMKRRGVEFYDDVPDIYYETMAERSGELDEDIELLKQQRILVDRDEDGYLLQIFTKPFGVRPTTYLEIIERKGATSFGNGSVIRKLTMEGKK